jgi:hypothetical protein
MTARELGQKMVELARKDDYPTIYGELYSPTVVSTEADGKTYTGMAEIEAKNEWWSSAMEVHSTECSDAFPHGDSFAIIWKMDVTEKASGHRFTMEEVIVYDVADGRIVKERFFYTMG